MNTFCKSLTVLLVVGLVTSLGASMATASILGMIVERGSPFPSTALNTIEDSNAEVITKGVGNTQLDRFEVGDSVELHMVFNTISSATLYLETPLDETLVAYPDYQLSGIGYFTITAIDNITGIIGSGGVGDFTFDGFFDFYEVADKTVDPLGPLTDSDVDFLEGVSDTRDTIMLPGAPILSLGIVDSDDFIVAYNAPIAFLDIPVPGSGSGVEALFGLSVIGSQDLGLVEETMVSTGSTEAGSTDTLHDVTGSSESFLAAGFPNAEYSLRTNTNINFNATVPEPASIVLWGAFVALTGLVSLRRRKS